MNEIETYARLIQLFFPQDRGGPAVTFAGAMHLFVSGITAFGTMIAVLAAALWFRARVAPALALHSFITVIVIFAGGLAGAGLAATGSQVMGLFERVPIMSFQQWLLVVSLALLLDLDRKAVLAGAAARS